MVEFYNHVDKIKDPALVSPFSLVHFLFGILTYSLLKKRVKPMNNVLISNIIHGMKQNG